MIGVFDSGIGGVTVLKELIKELPNEHFIYYSDSINNPYGDKDYDTIINICDNITKYLINKGCKIIVIACNTASCTAREYLRNKYPDIKFVVTEPAVKPVFDNNKNSISLIMATKRTINSDNFNFLYNKYKTKESYKLMCPGLADLIEEGDKEKINNYLKDLFNDYLDKDIDSIVLGCTHYPLIKDMIRDYFPSAIFYDGSYGVSNQTRRVFNSLNIPSNNKLILEFIDSSNNINKEKLFFTLALDCNK